MLYDPLFQSNAHHPDSNDVTNSRGEPWKRPLWKRTSENPNPMYAFRSPCCCTLNIGAAYRKKFRKTRKAGGKRAVWYSIFYTARLEVAPLTCRYRKVPVGMRSPSLRAGFETRLALALERRWFGACGHRPERCITRKRSASTLNRHPQIKNWPEWAELDCTLQYACCERQYSNLASCAHLWYRLVA